MSAPVNQTRSPLRKLSRFRFSLRTFLIVTTLFGIGVGWFAKVQHRVQRQRRVVNQIQSVRAGVGYDYQIASGWNDEKWQPPGPKVLRMLLGDDAFAEVHSVNLVGPKGQYESTPGDLASLAVFPRLQVLRVGGEQFGDESLTDIVRHQELFDLGLVETKVTARGLRELRALARLSMLELCGAGIDDDALHEVSQLPHLERLQLHFTRVTADGWRKLANLPTLKQLDIYPGKVIGDAELTHLSGLKKLEMLRLYQSAASDNGVRQLAGLTQLRNLQLNRAQVGDEGLKIISRLPHLQRLELDHSQITDVGIAHLEQTTRLEWLRIEGTEVTDAGIAQLKSLRSLKCLWVGPHVTKAGAEQLQQELPECEIRGWGKAGCECFSLDAKKH